MAGMTYSRTDMAELWWTGLADSERDHLVRQFRDQHGGDAVPEPTALELWDGYNRGEIVLGHETPSRDSQD